MVSDLKYQQRWYLICSTSSYEPRLFSEAFVANVAPLCMSLVRLGGGSTSRDGVSQFLALRSSGDVSVKHGSTLCSSESTVLLQEMFMEIFETFSDIVQLCSETDSETVRTFHFKLQLQTYIELTRVREQPSARHSPVTPAAFVLSSLVYPEMVDVCISPLWFILTQDSTRGTARDLLWCLDSLRKFDGITAVLTSANCRVYELYRSIPAAFSQHFGAKRVR
ncbi:hypothetical protein RRG08_010799 [Elysia crispata]|uniref:CTLH domain-containing protein n=1 Tax=Elysia crispata TaxID=231223 RepID=A0AAE0ZEV1_9GAST|nr:hypothetical protein RRG08_010799 [Elysia crispata]